MNLYEAQEYIRRHALSVKRLAKLGDRLAASVMAAYGVFYRNQDDPKAQAEWLRVIEEYVRREVTLTEIADLERRYGKDSPALH